MNSDENPKFGKAQTRPRKKLAPMTEWRTPTLPEYAPMTRTTPPRTVKLLGVAFALIVIVAGLSIWLSQPDVADLVDATPIPEKTVPTRKNTAPVVSHAPVNLPSGLMIDRSSVLNYDLAGWLVTTPLSARTFVFDRVRFGAGSAVVRDEDKGSLQVLVQILTAYPQAKATIIGNGPGTLGIDRATAIRDVLLQLAADPTQLAVAAGDGSESAPRLTVKLEMGVGTDLDA